MTFWSCVWCPKRFQLWYLIQQCLSFFSQELLREREKQKEAEVDALKRSMQSGMVGFCCVASILPLILRFCRTNSSFLWFLTHQYVWLPGTSNEGASSTEGGDGLSVQGWKFRGMMADYELSLCCNFRFSIFPLLLNLWWPLHCLS